MRYRVVFTPVGWQVVDTVEARDPLGEYGFGTAEHYRAKLHAETLNAPHEVEVRQTADGWHYAKCTCGWRQPTASPPAKRDDAVLRGQIHCDVRS